MIRINLLKPALGSASEAGTGGRPRPGGGWISPREVGIGAFVLVAGGALLFYLESGPGPPPRVQPKQTKGILPSSSPAPAQPAPARPEFTQPVAVAPPVPAPAAKAGSEPVLESAPERQGAPAQPAQTASVPTVKPKSQPAPAVPYRHREAPAGKSFQVSEVAIRRQPPGLTVLVRVETGARYREMNLKSPARLVVDIPNSRLSVPAAQRLLQVNHPVLRSVRASQFQTDPAISRIVLDLTSIPRYEIRPGREGLEIRILGGNP